MSARKNSGGVGYAQQRLPLRRSHHRSFGGTGGCIAACGGIDGVDGRAYGLGHLSLPTAWAPLCVARLYYI